MRSHLVQWYEDLRAQACGQNPPTTPRGLFLFLRSGLLAWMRTCAPVATDTTPGKATSFATATPTHRLAGMSSELVGVITEMALGGLKRCRL